MFWNIAGWRVANNIDTERIALLESNGIKIEHKVRCRDLEFYEATPKPLLVEIQLTSDEPCWPRAYFIIKDQQFYPLDGTSPPIHHLNAAEGGIDLTQAETYCDFFCSFVAGEGGPFPVLSSLDDLEWPHDLNKISFVTEHRSRIKSDLKQETGQRHDSTINFVKNEFYRWFDEKAHADTNGAQAPARPWVGLWRVENDQEMGRVLKELETSGPGMEIILGNFAEREKTPDRESVYLVGTIQYSANVFRSLFRVFRSGMVEMVDDLHLRPDLSPLPVDTWRFEPGWLQVPYRALNRHVSVRSEAVQRLFWEAKVPVAPVYSPEDFNPDRKAGSDFWTRQSAPVDIGPADVDMSLEELNGCEFSRPIVVEEVVFVKDLDLSDIRSTKRIEFNKCKFLGSLQLDNAVINSTLSFKECQFWGLPEPYSSGQGQDNSKKVERARLCEQGIAVSLNGIRISGDLVFERCKAAGSVLMHGAVVQGRGKFRGLQVFPLYEGLFDSPESKEKWGRGECPVSKRFLGETGDVGGGVGLDLRYSSFGPGLDLSPSFESSEKEAMGGASATGEDIMPTVVVGLVRADACTVAGPFNATGLVCVGLGPQFRYAPVAGWTGLSVKNARIGGDVSFWKPLDNPNAGFKYVRAVLGQSGLDLSSAEVIGSIDVRGIWIGGELNCELARITGHVWVNSFEQANYDDFPDNFCTYRPSDALAIPDEITLNPDDITLNAELARFGRTHVGQSINLSRARVGGSIDASGCYVGNEIILNQGDYGSVRCGSSISAALKPARLAQYCQKFGPRVAFIEVTQDKPEEDPEDKPRLLLMRCEAARFSLEDSNVNGYVNLTGIYLAADRGKEEDKRLGEELERLASSVSDQDSKKSKEEQDPLAKGPNIRDRICIENCKIEGALKLFDPEAFETWAKRIRGGGAAVNGWYGQIFGIDGGSARLDDLEQGLRERVPMEWLRAYCAGAVKIVNSTIDGALIVSGARILGKLKIQDVNLTSDLSADLYPKGMAVTKPGVDLDVLPVGEEPAYLVTSRLVLETLRCDGDAWLAGVRTYRLNNGSGGAGNLDAHNMTVKGRLHMVKEVELESGAGSGKKTKTFKADIQGAADFTGCTVSEFRLGGCDDVSLERATIQHLDVYGDKDNKFEGFPLKLDLRGTCFEQLTVCDGKDDSDKSLLKLLTRDRLKRPDRPFNTEPGSRVERIMRMQGRRDEAKKVYIRQSRRWVSSLPWYPKILPDRPTVMAVVYLMIGLALGAVIYCAPDLSAENYLLMRFAATFVILLFVVFNATRLFYHFYDGLAGFGAGTGRLLVYCTLLFILCLVGLTGSAANWQDPANASPFRKTLEISVPVVSWLKDSSGDDLNSTGSTYLWVPDWVAEWIPERRASPDRASAGGQTSPASGEIVIFQSSPKDVAVWFHLAGWILWPLLLLVLSGFIKRE